MIILCSFDLILFSAFFFLGSKLIWWVCVWAFAAIELVHCFWSTTPAHLAAGPSCKWFHKMYTIFGQNTFSCELTTLRNYYYDDDVVQSARVYVRPESSKRLNEIGLRNNNNITCGVCTWFTLRKRHWQNTAECRRDDCQTFLAQSSTQLAHHFNRRITSHIECAIEFIYNYKFSLCIECQSANEWSLIFRTKCISVPSEKCDKFSFKRYVMWIVPLWCELQVK